MLFRPFASGILDSSRRPSVKKYFTNRALRIYPAYLVILFIVSLVIGKAYATSIPEGVGVEGSSETVGYMTDPIALITNALMVHTLFPDTVKTALESPGPSPWNSCSIWSSRSSHTLPTG